MTMRGGTFENNEELTRLIPHYISVWNNTPNCLTGTTRIGGMPILVSHPAQPVKFPCRNRANIRGRVFMTYSVDSVKHVADVLKLHDLLVSNHFRCRLEEYDKHMVGYEYDRLNTLFHEVDFILVCISPEYKAVTQDPNAGFDYDQRTQYIYQSMLREYCVNACTNKRFIPVVFERSGATRLHVPQWLSQSSSKLYTWRSDWKDLIKDLSKAKHYKKPVDERLDR